MTILPISNPAFASYGKVLEGYDTQDLLRTLLKSRMKKRRVSEHPLFFLFCGHFWTSATLYK